MFAPPAPERGKVGPPAKTAAKAHELMQLSSTEIAATACRLGSMLLVKAGQKRYGDDAVMLALDEEETKEVTKIGARVLDAYLPQMAPEWALVITLGIIYTSKITTLEMARNHNVPAAQLKAAAEKMAAEQATAAQSIAASIQADAARAEGAQA